LILFPLEYHYGFVSNLSQEIVNLFVGSGVSASQEEYTFKLFDAIPLTAFLVSFIDNGFILVILSFVLLFGSIKLLSKLISQMIIGESQDKLRKYLFHKPFRSFSWGVLLTAGMQSSSITTSLVVPFVAKNKIKIKKATPFILGANIGTTITAFIAVLFKSDTVMSIAITHLLINLAGVLIFLPFPLMHNLLVKLANAFGTITMKYRLAGLTYIIFTFFIIPFALIYFNQTDTKFMNLTYRITQDTELVEQKEIISKIYTGRRTDPILGNAPYIQPASNVYHVYKEKNVIFINQRFFLVNKPGFCWDDENKEGKFQMCIERIIPEMQLEGGKSVDSVYVYKQEFYNPARVDSISYQFKLSASQLLLVSKEKLNKNNRILQRELLTDYQLK
ncbi:MAG: Na/Pi symporter, partial [Fulvivirga sp.]|nr:Na/Pi symporter [Fulvivirga sp.]